MNKRTKIICTVGPAVSSYEKIVELIHAGMNVARINLSHGDRDFHSKMIEYLKKARRDLKIPLAIMFDTRGPEIRLGEIEGTEIELKKGEKWFLSKKSFVGNIEHVSITPSNILDNLTLETRILFNDGYISSKIVEVTDDAVLVEIENDGYIESKKGVNIPDVCLDLPSVTEKDISDIKFGCENGIDIIALSFVRSQDNIITVKNILKDLTPNNVLIISKIESAQGVKNFDSILQVSDGVMIARGDLGVEVALSIVPRLQKEMIRKCYLAGKPSITATQMLESMIHNPRPTRAEVSDVANAIYDSTSAVMLSGETAIGKYPIETVEIMKKIVRQAEEDFNYDALFANHSKFKYPDVPSSIALASVKTANSSNAAAIFTFTSKGGSARLLSRLRPKMPIVAMTPNEKVYNQMAINWGVIPLFGRVATDYKEAFTQASEFALEKKICSFGDLVIITAGTTFGITGTTNMMVVENIGDVLVRGQSGVGQRIFGNVQSLISIEQDLKPYNIRGKILIITKCDSSYEPYIKEAHGIILQNQIQDVESEKFLLEKAEKLNKTAIVRADAARQILRDGQLITIDPEKALIYKGVVT